MSQRETEMFGVIYIMVVLMRQMKNHVSTTGMMKCGVALNQT